MDSADSGMDSSYLTSDGFEDGPGRPRVEGKTPSPALPRCAGEGAPALSFRRAGEAGGHHGHHGSERPHREDEAVVERLIGARAYARSLLSVAATVAGRMTDGRPEAILTLYRHARRIR